MAEIYEPVISDIREAIGSKITPREKLIAVTAALLKLPANEWGQIVGVAQNQVMPKGVPAGYAKVPGEA
jgi:hypothetical protein